MSTLEDVLDKPGPETSDALAPQGAGHPDKGFLTRAPCSAPALKPLKSLLDDRKGDANLQGFAVTDPLDFQFPERLV